MNTDDRSKDVIGIVGLGLVGRALAGRLRCAGFELVGWDVKLDAMRAFEEAGYRTANSVSALAQVVRTLVLAVFDTAGVHQVVEAILADPCMGTDAMPLTLLDCSTGDPEALTVLAARLRQQGIVFIEAPLSGSSTQIAAGDATLLLGAEPSDLSVVAPVLDALSPHQVHVGGAGMAACAKLATNLVLGLNRAALAEGMVFAQSMGIAPEAFLRLVLATPARSDAALIKGAMMVKEDFVPQSRIRQHLKDVRLMLQAAAANGQRLPLSDTHAALMQAAVDAGDGELDNAAIIRQLRRETNAT